ncbi:hypothetical protein [Flavilitoribacter nigricans]|uniref:HPt domain-containing protein n=1 Tax=Flavilitoribacter nigricans (strain ATCC 23147 / DSM 23189 / NBRC 102662 / NCIMB 1420 / SS-2) TaxID=1122177 RepID=A0A2D0N1I1_FLAN2|nr:hypothetical protein [Flavilitoribacter nigricans]PHN02355.1 hypothetical protein CRP01_32440 [Flavilitoribacter nigricans DSM 23189 = NBRC 102662]
MDIKWNTSLLDLKNLIGISRGDPDQILKYLEQFQKLIPPRLAQLQQGLGKKDREMIRKIVHQMSPQLQFFGIEGIGTTITRLEFEYETLPMEELEDLVKHLIINLESALLEIVRIIRTYFK